MSKLTAKEIWALRQRGLRLPQHIKSYSSAKLSGLARRFNRAMDEADECDKMIREIADEETQWFEFDYNQGQTMVICLDETCPYRRDCANHVTAGDFREEGGLTPNLKLIRKELKDAITGQPSGYVEQWRCTKSPQDHDGALLINGQRTGWTL